MGMTITEFLTARLDEKKRVAQAAELLHPGPWQQRPSEGGLPNGVWVDDARDEGVAVANGSYVAGHVLLHDPARVLTEVEAKRRVMARHHDDGYGACAGCGHEYADISLRYSIEECPELRDLAAPDAGHPDYNPGWRVQ